MSNAKTTSVKSPSHAPGPWRITGESYDEDSNPVPQPWGLEDSEGRTIFSTGGGEYTHPDWPTMQLIASAPDLLRERDEALDRLDTERRYHDETRGYRQRAEQERDEWRAKWEALEIERAACCAQMEQERDEARAALRECAHLVGWTAVGEWTRGTPAEIVREVEACIQGIEDMRAAARDESTSCASGHARPACR